MADPELTYLSASQAISLFKSRALSPVELMEAMIHRAEEVEPVINAFADQYFDEALKAAKKAETKYRNPKSRIRALEGLPLVVKDDTAIKGRRTTTGSLMFQNHVDDYTNPSVERLMRAGAIVHARTTCPEFCWAWVCYSRLYGVTRNPWNTDYTCGGSSGGSAAALAAGTTILATGTDSAGSIRQPAALCGVVGYKPPYGRNPQGPHETFDAYNHIGPMTRSVEDSLLMQNVMVGPHALDPTSVSPRLRLPNNFKTVKGLKIAYSVDLGYYEVAKDVRRETLAVIQALSDAGAQVEEIAMPWGKRAVELSGYYGDHLHSAAFEEAMEKHADLVCDYTPYFAEQNRQVSRKDFHDSIIGAGQIWHDHLGPLFQEFDALICPTTAMQEVPADMRPWDSVHINGREVDVNDTAMTILFNMFSRCPVMSIPSGFADSGVPTGVQIVGRPYDDKTVFRIAYGLEKLRPLSSRAEVK